MNSAVLCYWTQKQHLHNNNIYNETEKHSSPCDCVHGFVWLMTRYTRTKRFNLDLESHTHLLLAIDKNTFIVFQKNERIVTQSRVHTHTHTHTHTHKPEKDFITQRLFF